MSDSLFITGATGNVGAALVCDILETHPTARIQILVRSHSELDARHRLMAALRTYRPGLTWAAIGGRLGVLVGDIAKPDLGLSARAYARLAEATNYIIHSAALTCFRADPTMAETVNVTGTEHMLSLAQDIRRSGSLKRIIHISTAYVCGNKVTGSIGPDYLPPRAPETNVYERSKWQAERVVRDHLDALPLMIVRPSIVVGDSRTGRIINFNVLYPPLRLLLPRLRANAVLPIDGLLDVVPADYVAAALGALLFSEKPVDAAAYHLTAGRNAVVTVGELLSAAARLVRSSARVTVDSETALRELVGRLKTYLPYLSFQGEFDRSRSDFVLAETGLKVQPVTSYLATLLAYCYRTRWGKSPIREETADAHRAYRQSVFAATGAA